MVVGPWVMVNAVIDFSIRVTSALSAEFPYRPIPVVLVVEKLDECISRVAIGALGIG